MTEKELTLEKRFANAIFITVLLAIAILLADAALSILNSEEFVHEMEALIKGKRLHEESTPLVQVGVSIIGLAPIIGILAILPQLAKRYPALVPFAISAVIIIALTIAGIIRA